MSPEYYIDQMWREVHHLSAIDMFDRGVFVAGLLNDPELASWFQRELDGYPVLEDHPSRGVPAYRWVSCEFGYRKNFQLLSPKEIQKIEAKHSYQPQYAILWPLAVIEEKLDKEDVWIDHPEAVRAAGLPSKMDMVILVRESSLRQLVSRLKQECLRRLRSAQEDKTGEQESRVDQLVASFQLAEALDLIATLRPESTDETTLLKARLSQLRKGERLGTMAQSEIQVAYARLTQAILALAQDRD